jgi:dienelactone hydrolase
MHEIALRSLNPVTLREVASAEPIDVPAYLTLPPTDIGQPGPAVVIAEGLGGLKASRECSYGQRLAEAGYVTLVPNSFAARGFGKMPHNWRALGVTEGQMLADAFASLCFLARHPAVDPGRIGIVGFSYGGMTSILTAYRQLRQLYMARFGLDAAFAAHASYYGCSVPRLDDPATTGSPLAIFLGECDRNVSVARTRVIAEDLRRGGSDVDLQVFPGVYHQWDGDDEKKRFVRFALGQVRMRVTRDSRLIDEKTGLQAKGRVRRALAIALSVSLRGYHIQHSAETVVRSDALLRAFFARALGGDADLEQRIAVAAQ